jgi:DNA (cytosine-5)-methyltransferase 1
MLNGLDLFSGIGGIAVALQPWVRTVAYVEIDAWCQAVLWERMRDGRLDVAPVWDDITTFDPRPFAGAVDIVSGGFPCQDASRAGPGGGVAGGRTGLWWEAHRIIRELRPMFVFLENTPGILSAGRGAAEVTGSLAALGYDLRWGVVGADAIGAPHHRARWWVLAYSGSEGLALPKQKAVPGEGRREEGRAVAELPTPINSPDLGGSIHGLPARVDRVRSLGNSVVPHAAQEAFRRLMFGE